MKSLVLIVSVTLFALTTMSGCGGNTKPTLIGGEMTDAQIQEFEAEQKRQQEETMNAAEESEESEESEE